MVAPIQGGQPPQGPKKSGGPESSGEDGQDPKQIGAALVKAGLEMLKGGGKGGQEGGGGGADSCPNCQGGGLDAQG